MFQFLFGDYNNDYFSTARPVETHVTEGFKEKSDQQSERRHSLEMTVAKPDNEPDPVPSWNKLVYDFTQETTFHGVRYITASTRYMVRRVVWTVVVLLATGVFGWFMIDRLRWMLSHPKAVDVEVIYTDNLVFPSVTICNQNFIRRSAVHGMGLHDEMESGFEGLGDDANYRKESLKDNGQDFEVHKNALLEGLGDTYTKFVDVTASVCQHVCAHLESGSCCSIVYDRVTKSCYITPLDKSLNGVNLVPSTSADTYHMRKCKVHENLECDFERDLCDLTQKQDDSFEWKRTRGRAISDRSKPAYDHTNKSGLGHYLWAQSREWQPGMSAELVSPYLTSNGSSCLTFYYQLRGARLSVSLKVQSQDRGVVWSAKGSSVTEWERGLVQLPVGYYRVVIEGTSERDGVPTNLAIDDVQVAQCEPISDCRDTKMGKGYQGKISYTGSGKECQYWNTVKLSKRLYKNRNQLNTSYSLFMQNDQNYCRNPNNDPNGPWCFTSLETGRMEYCDVPYCDCQEWEYKCTNSRCVARELLCDGKDNCGDMSDEGHVTCGYKLTAECDFGNKWLCGYKTSKTTKLSWVRRGEERNKHMAVDFNYGIMGDQASMDSPRFEVPSGGCLSFKYILDPQTDLRVYVTDIGRKIELTPCGLADDLDWRQIYLPLPNGTFSLSFEATLTGSRRGAVVSVDDIHIEHKKCIDESIYPFTTEPEVTTEVPSTTTPRPRVNWWNITRDLFDTSWPEFNRTNSSFFSTGMTTSSTTVKPEVKIELLRHLNQWFNVSICRNYTEAVEKSLPNPNKEDCTTQESTECDFEGACHCGYQVVSSNKFIAWKKETKFGGHASRWYPSASDHFIKTRAIPGQPVRTADWTRLVSPVVTVTKVSCMRFKYTTNQAQLNVLTQNNTDVTVLAEVPGALTDRAWKHLYLPLHPGTYSVGFEVKVKEPATFSAGIDSIEIVDRRCSELSRNGLKECDFSRGDNCNFIDRSEGLPRWVVNKQIGSEEPGGYFMYAESPSSSKSSSVLLSPEYRLRYPGCLRFYYFMDSDLEGSISTLSVTAQVSQGSQVLLWSVRGLQSSAWMEAVAALPPGYFRFLFEFNGQRSRAGIDKVSVLERRCPKISCNSDQFLCSTSLTCIPNEALCDGIENCQNGDDELDCTDTDNNTDEHEEFSMAMENPSEPEYDLSTVSDEREASLKNIFETSGHQGIDFIYKCKWDGKRCAYENFTQQITDYGLCYTFNGDGQLTTEKTGSRFGLSLTLNIEQYEYMAGPNSDAGVKVYLHEGKEVAQVRDLGFAISPGTHALVAVRINEAQNLKEPWGSCGERQLVYYDEYFYSRCLRECETKFAIKQCGCRDAYMPGRSLNDPPICNLTKYFGCVIPTTDTFTAASPCGCPDPCRHTVYEPVLSYAAISTSNLNFILNENVERLRQKYDTVLESNERVTKDTFASAIQQVKDVSDHYRQLLRFVNLYIGTGKSSVFIELGKTMSTIAHLFSQDIDILFEEISDFVESYDSRFLESDRTFVKYLNDLGSKITDLIQILELVSTGAGANKAIELEIEGAIGLAKISRETAASLERKREEYKREERYKVRGTNFLLYKNENECRYQFDRLDRVLGDVNTAFSSAKRVISFNTDRKASISEMVQLQGLYEEVSGAVVKCLTDYSRLIRNISSWNETVTVDIKDELSKYTDDSEDQYGLASSYAMMEEDLKLVDDLYRKYRLAELTRHELLGQFTADIGRMARVKNFASILKYKVSDKLNADVTNLQEKLRTHYLKAMTLAGDLEYYRGSGYFYDKGRAMKIWQLPMVNLDDPERYILKGQEVWKIWNRNMPTKEFAQTQGREQIENNLDNYTHTVFKILEGFDEQLLVHETTMIEAIETLNTQQDIETSRRTLNKDFAQNNFLKMDVYFAQLKRQTVRQMKAYVNTDFLSDIGGFMGLLLGGSVLTVFELLDLIIYNGMLKVIDRRHAPRRGRTAEKDNNSTPERRNVTMANEVFTKVNRNDIFNNV